MSINKHKYIFLDCGKYIITLMWIYKNEENVLLIAETENGNLSSFLFSSN